MSRCISMIVTVSCGSSSPSRAGLAVFYSALFYSALFYYALFYYVISYSILLYYVILC